MGLQMLEKPKEVLGAPHQQKINCNYVGQKDFSLILLILNLLIYVGNICCCLLFTLQKWVCSTHPMKHHCTQGWILSCAACSLCNDGYRGGEVCICRNDRQCQPGVDGEITLCWAWEGLYSSWRMLAALQNNRQNLKKQTGIWRNRSNTVLCRCHIAQDWNGIARLHVNTVTEKMVPFVALPPVCKGKILMVLA